MATNPLLERLKKSIQKRQGLSTGKSFAIATAILEKNGYQKPGTTQLTEKGKIKQTVPEGVKGIPVKYRLKARLNKIKK